MQNETSIYPDWCLKPYRLTNQEIENPTPVIEEFFETYSLRDIREVLRVWLAAALRPESAPGQDYLYHCEKLEKFIEAVWVKEELAETA